MPKPRNGYGDNNGDYGWDTSPRSGCALCDTPEPQTRMKHHLQVAKDQGLDALKAHLMDVYVYKRESHRQRPDSVEDIYRWAENLIGQYSNMPDPHTGAPMPWWEARRMMQQAQPEIDRQMYERAPEKFKQHQARLTSVRGFYQVPNSARGKFSPQATVDNPQRILEPEEYMREPGEDEIDEDMP